MKRFSAVRAAIRTSDRLPCASGSAATSHWPFGDQRSHGADPFFRSVSLRSPEPLDEIR